MKDSEEQNNILNSITEEILIYLCTRESFEITADLPSAQPALILSMSPTQQIKRAPGGRLQMMG